MGRNSDDVSLIAPPRFRHYSRATVQLHVFHLDVAGRGVIRSYLRTEGSETRT